VDDILEKKNINVGFLNLNFIRFLLHENNLFLSIKEKTSLFESYYTFTGVR
jgi:hypothetical protein